MNARPGIVELNAQEYDMFRHSWTWRTTNTCSFASTGFAGPWLSYFSLGQQTLLATERASGLSHSTLIQALDNRQVCTIYTSALVFGHWWQALKSSHRAVVRTLWCPFVRFPAFIWRWSLPVYGAYSSCLCWRMHACVTNCGALCSICEIQLLFNRSRAATKGMCELW